MNGIKWGKCNKRNKKIVLSYKLFTHLTLSPLIIFSQFYSVHYIFPICFYLTSPLFILFYSIYCIHLFHFVYHIFCIWLCLINISPILSYFVNCHYLILSYLLYLPYLVLFYIPFTNAIPFIVPMVFGLSY